MVCGIMVTKVGSEFRDWGVLSVCQIMDNQIKIHG